jgi:predicted TPR repeat methyltransferase
MPQKTMDPHSRATHYELTFPSEDGLEQDEEWCVVRAEGLERRVRFHDYGDIYELPGLYEQLFYEHMECQSPQTVAGLLAEELERSGADTDSLRAFDVGAGNGMVAERLADIGVDTIVGADIIDEAAVAAERDRPGLYDDYFVVDLTSLDDDVRRELEQRRFNLLTCVAALGFGDMPPAAFATAYDVLTPDAWLAFSIKTDFLDENGDSGFATLIRELAERKMIEIQARKRYRHRLSSCGEPVHYVAIVAAKRGTGRAGPLAAEL